MRAYDSHDEPENPVEREPIASAQTDLKPLADGALHDVRLDLGPAGAVDLSVQYAEMDGELLDDLANRVRHDTCSLSYFVVFPGWSRHGPARAVLRHGRGAAGRPC